MCHDYIFSYYGPLTRYVKLRIAHAPGMPGTFPPQPKPLVSDPGIHHGMRVTHVQWCNNKTVLLRDKVHQISRGEPAAAGLTAGQFNQYLPVDLTSLNVSNSRFRKSVMFWRWRRHGVALWRHGRDAWHNCLLLATASNVNCWNDVANHVIDCGKRVIRKISNSGSRASYGPYHGLELPNHGINVGIASPQWRGKRCRHFRRMSNPQFYVSGKRPIDQVGDHKNIAYPRSVEEKCH